jgi:hypothetical protein
MAVFKAWTTTQLTNLGLWLANAFGVGPEIAPPIAASDTWTPESLATFGLEMSKGFGGGL